MITARLISLFLFCNTLSATELVQIDVGNAINFNSVLQMESTKKVDVSNHGTHMALALESQLFELKSKPVKAKQVTWEINKNSRDSLLIAMKEALEEEPKVLSLSYGGKRKDSFEEAFITAFTVLDAVVVAAAGNDGHGRTYFPANYNNPCILSVGTTFNGRKAPYSNFADSWLEYHFGDPHGTSASTARMAAIVLQIRRQNPEMTCDKVVLTVKMLYGKVKK